MIRQAVRAVDLDIGDDRDVAGGEHVKQVGDAGKASSRLLHQLHKAE